MKKMRRIIIILVAIIVIVIGVKKIGGELYTKYLYMSYPEKYNSYVLEYSKEYGVNPVFVRAIIKTESNYNPSATSNVGAKGLMQITDSTGEDIANKIGITNFEPNMLYNPQTSIQFGTYYLSRLINEFNDDPKVVIAAYNAGSGNVAGWLQNSQYSNDGVHLTNIPFPETKEYVKNVLKNENMYYKLYGKK